MIVLRESQVRNPTPGHAFITRPDASSWHNEAHVRHPGVHPQFHHRAVAGSRRARLAAAGARLGASGRSTPRPTRARPSTSTTHHHARLSGALRRDSGLGSLLAWVDVSGPFRKVEGEVVRNLIEKRRTGVADCTRGRGRCKQNQCLVTLEAAQGAALRAASRECSTVPSDQETCKRPARRVPHR
jgi:hypothetical protein